MENYAIQINNVSKNYGKFKAILDADLKIEQGKIYGLIGKNGAGKSTLFKLILGLSSYHEGEILINGSKDSKERSKIGFFISSNFFPDLNAKENLIYQCKLKRITDKSEVDRVLKIVDLFGVKKDYKSFSMGMKQRLGIASAILGSPSIVILDEPINGLDPQGIKEIRELIKHLSHDLKMTVLVSSHILSELELIADKFGIIHQGRMIKEYAVTDEKESRTYLSTTNNIKALQVLNMFKIETNNENRLILNETLSLSQVFYPLIKENIEILEFYTENQTLEENYFKLTGGTQ